MPLSSAQLVTVSEILLRPLDEVEGAAESITSDQEDSIEADVTLWNTIRNSHVKLDDDVNFDNERKRQAIRERVGNILGLSLYQMPTIFTIASGTRGF